ncbi:MAG: LuxR C-terminal-related transcriptional regulator [Anaerolineae bacterium]|nr:LuxR C-terminal-related transcriptional regulator [Anaerolineae bacterium]
MASQNHEELSERELELLRLVARGATNQQIARELTISVNTVKVHLRNIFAKLGVESRTEATMVAVQRGLIRVEAPVPEEPAAAASVPAWPPLPRPAASWQRVYLILAAAAAVVLVALSLAGPHSQAGRAADAFLDASAAAPALPPQLPSRWAARAPMPTARARLAVVATSDGIFAIGGVANGQVTGAVEQYLPAEDRWVTHPPKPTPAANIGAVALDGRIYVPGGHDAQGRVLNALEIYDLAAQQWTQGPSLPVPRSAYALAEVGGRMYLFGGWDGRKYVDTVLEFSPDTGTWNVGAPMPEALGFQAAAVLGGRIFLIGGYDGNREVASCYEYTPDMEGSAASPWQPCPPLSIPRGGAAAATVGNSIYVVGGGWKGFVAYNERYELQGNIWVRFPTPIVGQWRNLGLAAFETRLYAIGGWSGEALNANSEYQALFRVVMPRTVR